MKTRIYKVLSVLVVYALFLNEFVPFAAAMSTDISMISPIYSGSFEATNTIFLDTEASIDNDSDEAEVIPKRLAPPSLAAASSSGAGQAETGGFSIGSTDGMVNKFTGDFSYSIPLMDVEGYPIVLSYSSNVTMLQEASWVGLGWDLNVGAVSREMRGIPDEFNGEQDVVRVHNELPSATTGAKLGGYFATGGGPQNGASGVGGGGQVTTLLGSYDDNYLGLGNTIDFGLGGQFSISGGKDNPLFYGANANLGFSYDSKNGIGHSQGIGSSAGYGAKEGAQASGSLSFGQSTNSRYGLMQKSLTNGVSGGFKGKHETLNEDKKVVFTDYMNGSASLGATSTIAYGTATSTPRIKFNSTDGSSFNFQSDLYFKIKTGALYYQTGVINQGYNADAELDINNNSKTLYQPAYGYMHSGKRASDNNDGKFPIMDFNRGSEDEFSEEMKNLPFSIQTHDIFYANASGLGATFRPLRKDFGTYYDPETETLVNDGTTPLGEPSQVNISFGGVYDVSMPSGIGFGIGSEFGTMQSEVKSGDWTYAGTHILDFDLESQGDQFDESVFFRSVGEHTPVDMTKWNLMSGGQADYYDVGVASGEIEQTSYLKLAGTNVTGNSLNGVGQTTVNATVFEPQIAGSLTSSDPTYRSTPREGSSDLAADLGRVSGDREANHISRLDVVTPNGMQYTYGIPVYNYSSSEVSFASGGLTSSNNDGLITYVPGTDNSADNNQRGRGHFYDKTTIPSYAHSFLLTEMRSSDYIDRTGNGLTLDDIGSWYKFNHSRVYEGDADINSAYKWRFPICGDAANPTAQQSRGVLGSELDDIANYSYGEKEIWYTHSVESKNFIAIFYLGDREDMHSVQGENGGLDQSKPLQKLDSIVLYNKSDWIKGLDEASYPNYDALPLQTVVFDHNYSLCENSPGNPATYTGGGAGSGKLTLTGIRFYGGNSREAGLSGYQFDYGSTLADNPDFDYFNIDAWGSYKPNDVAKANDVFPYADQREANANSYAQAWKLKAITNPAGGRVEVAYEADRYETVQYRRAMRHFKVHGMVDIFRFLEIQDENDFDGTLPEPNRFHTSWDDGADMANDLGLTLTPAQITGMELGLEKNPFGRYLQKFGTVDLEAVPQNVIVFELDEPISTNDATPQEAMDLVRQQYFRDNWAGPNVFLRELYFKTHVVVKDGVEELVPLVADISEDYENPFSNFFSNASAGGFDDDFLGFGVMPVNATASEYQYGYVVIDPVNTGDREEISGDGKDKLEKGSLVMNPLQLMSLQFARQYLTDQVYGSCDGCDPNLSIDWKVFFGQDMYEYMIKEGDYAQSIVNPATSDLTTLRLFEPDRVKFGGNARVASIKYLDNWNTISSEYDSEYTWEYKYTEPLEDGRLVESGVAAFEARSAKDENSLYIWDSYINIKKKFPDERKFTPTPLAEQLFPTPIIGYRHVEVHFIGDNDYGHSVSKFHTSREYKYRTKATSTSLDNDTRISENNPIAGTTKEVFAFSQGHLVETNDFHGKPDETLLLDGQGNLIARSKYEYYDLGEEIPMVNRSGAAANETVATEYDIHADARFVSDRTDFALTGLNFEFFYVAPTSFSFNFSPSLTNNSRQRGFYSHNLVKHINRSAVLKGVTTEYLASVNHANNELFDKYTGLPVLTSLVDEFNDKLFSMNYPSHWKFRELRDRHNINGQSETVTILANGSFVPSVSTPLSPGDYVQFNGSVNLFVAQEFPVPDDGSLFLINPDGSQYTISAGNYNVTILNSARDNRLVESMQTLVSKTSPYDFSTNQLIVPTNVLSSSIVSYRDRLNIACGTPCISEGDNNNEIAFQATYNPYEFGIRGALIVDGQYAWQDERSNLADLHGTRFDGAYSSYVPFYWLDNSEWQTIDDTDHISHDVSDLYQNWRKVSEVTAFNKFGSPMETRDQIGVHSSVLFGYSNKYTLVPIAQAINARQSEIAFDGFEDYDYLDDVNDKTCPPSETHFDFMEAINTGLGIELVQDERHSGLASLRVAANQDASISKNIDTNILCNALDALDAGPDDFVLDDECACILPFEPSPGKYVVGVWVKESVSGAASVNISYTGSTAQETFTPQGPVLDGWQRLEGVFDIPVGASEIIIALDNNNATGDVYFDDFRIHPFLAGMTTVVYDPKSLLPLATHDGYNFTTFYNYDENLNQVRVRVETIEGIRTITEVESGGQKN